MHAVRFFIVLYTQVFGNGCQIGRTISRVVQIKSSMNYQVPEVNDQKKRRKLSKQENIERKSKELNELIEKLM